MMGLLLLLQFLAPDFNVIVIILKRKIQAFIKGSRDREDPENGAIEGHGDDHCELH